MSRGRKPTVEATFEAVITLARAFGVSADVILAAIVAAKREEKK